MDYLRIFFGKLETEEYKLDKILNKLEKSRLTKRTKSKRPTVYLDTSGYKTYFTDEEIKKHRDRIIQLFVWNFGKDWEIYLFLEYSLIRGYHNVRYNSHHPLEDLSQAFVMRQAHFAKAKLLLHSYLTQGFDKTKSCIRLNQFRIIWRGQYWASSEISNILQLNNNIATTTNKQPSNTELPRIIAIEEADGYF